MISIGDIYDKNVSYLLGSGASFGVLPTLELALKNEEGGTYSLEDLAEKFEQTSDERLIPLFMHYYATCIRPAQLLRADNIPEVPGKAVIRNYEQFLKTQLAMLQRKQAFEKTCNLFTTNYDGCLSIAAENLLKDGSFDFVVNDGTRGFRTKFLQARNFNSFLCNTGVFDRHKNSIPQVNLIHLHGSVYWNKSSNMIQVDYNANHGADLLNETQREKLKPFSDALRSPDSKLDEIDTPAFSEDERNGFWSSYRAMPIVNPTKWKFHETVYEEHYYQMLRYLSYELEKPNAVLITFGFSFADEHILNLVRRSLSNPRLMVFVCCFNDAAFVSLTKLFQGYRNVKCIKHDTGNMTFEVFNEHILSTPKLEATGNGETHENADSTETK